jgi:hypothetical protein
MIRLTLTRNVNMACESQSKGESRKHAVFHPVHYGEQDFLGALLVVFVVAYEVRCHIVCEVVRVDVDEGAKENAKVWTVKCRGGVVENAIEGLSSALQEAFALCLLLLKFPLSSFGLGIDRNDSAWMMNGAVGVCADFPGCASAIAINDYGRL